MLINAALPVDFAAITTKQKHGIDAKEARNYIGKQVSICEHVYTVRETAAITQPTWVVNSQTS